MISYNSLNFNPFMFIIKNRNVNVHNIICKNTTKSRAKQPIGNKTRQNLCETVREMFCMARFAAQLRGGRYRGRKTAAGKHKNITKKNVQSY